ncbi:hypothetical protein PHLGIDRAFT_231783 [Phlebiopsis gigantea 11061_1 CR5-6]|uniref:C2H2-type domain-containing protein n=1 Tax=Phlebiopsis gigantea (strain 11061_1 CR5-6) TaxID=745531 RepID=A0A0C3SEG8_PHLG1|nr:hypothetical protein PHLGIDRAFT_231783 [Phlebiopsis gigantea 11061_1 CR5-6]
MIRHFAEPGHSVLYIPHQDALMISQYAINELPCKWHACKAVLNSWWTFNLHLFYHSNRKPHILVDHQYNHIDKQRAGQAFTCQWQACTLFFSTAHNLYAHVTTTHLSQVTLRCPHIGCSAPVASSQLGAHLQWEHGLGNKDVPVAADAPQHTCRPLPVATSGTPPPLLPRTESPETDVAFAPLPSHRTPTHAALPMLLAGVAHRSRADAEAVEAMLVCAAEDVRLLRTLRPDVDEESVFENWLSHAPEKPTAERRAELEEGGSKHFSLRKRSGWSSFGTAFNEAKAKGLIDGLGQLPSPERGNTPNV